MRVKELGKEQKYIDRLVYAWSGVRTHADLRPVDLKSTPLDLSGIQATGE